MGKYTACLEEVGAAVKLHKLAGVIIAVDAKQVAGNIKAALALEGNIMYGQKEAEIFLHCTVILGAGKHGDHCGMPVVAVEHFGGKAQIGDGIQHGTAEEAVLLQFIIAASVDLVAKVALTVHKVDSHIVQHQLFNAHILMTPSKVHEKVEHMFNTVTVLLLDNSVVGSDNSRVNGELCKGLGKGSHYVGKAAGFGQGGTLC